MKLFNLLYLCKIMIMSEIEEKSSFKKHRKYVYLDKYEFQIEDIKQDISHLRKTVLITTIALTLMSVALVLKELNIL